MMLVSTISYIDRNAIAVLIPTIQRETGLSAQEYGHIVAAFSYAYMIGNPLWGMLLDRIGVHLGMAVAVLLWSAAAASHAFAGGLWSFALLRTALGFCEGATFPGALRTVMQTLAPIERSRGIAFSYSGGSLGAIITPLLVTPIALAYGWRTAFLVTGLAGAFWLIWWWRLCRRADLSQPPLAQSTTPFQWLDRRVFAFVAIYAFGSVPLGFILYMAGIYLTKYFHLSQGQLGTVLWIPPLGWECGYFFWGWAMDRWVQSGTPALLAYRRAFGIGLVLAAPLAVAHLIPNLYLFMAELFLSMFVAGSFIVGGIAYATHVFGNQRAGLIAGLGAGSFSALTAITAPIFGSLLDQNRYAAAFLLASSFPLIGYVVWRLLQPSTDMSPAAGGIKQ
jgi:MFS transporter, ACS family, hexuronate transporter